MSTSTYMQVRKVQERTVKKDRVIWVYEGSVEALRRLAQQMAAFGIRMKSPAERNGQYQAEFYRPFNC